MNGGVGCRHGSDPALLLLWLWRRVATTALIQPLAWKPPCTEGAALENTKRQKKKRLEFQPGPATLSLCLSLASHLRCGSKYLTVLLGSLSAWCVIDTQ